MNNEKQIQIDKHFIQTEDKYKLPYAKLEDVSHEILFDFKHEINLSCLIIQSYEEGNYKLMEKSVDWADFPENDALMELNYLLCVCNT